MATIKTAISIQDSLYKEVEELAKKTNTSRSQLFTQAIRDFIEKYKNRALLAKINKAHSTTPNLEEKKWISYAKSSHRKLLEDE